VNTITAGGQLDPAVATLSDGSYVVTWRSDGRNGLTPDSTGKTLDEAASAAGLGTTEAQVLESPSQAIDGVSTISRIDSAWLILHQPQRECFLRNSLSFCIL
jgi:hypothetical protein